MKRIVIGVATVGVVAGALGAGALAFSDYQVDQQIENLRSQADQAGLQMSVVADDDQLLNRKVSLRLTSQSSEMSVPVIINNDIEQRPWGSRIQHEVVLDTDFSNFSMDPGLQGLLNEYLVERAFVSGESVVSFNGRYESELTSIEVSESTEQWTFNLFPMVLNIAGSPDGDVVLTGDWTGLQLRSLTEAMEMVVAPIAFKADGQFLSTGLFEGTQSMTIESVELNATSESDPIQLSLADLTVTSNGQVGDNRYSGDMTLELKQLDWAEGQNPVSVADVRLMTSVSGFEPENYERMMQEMQSMQSSGVPSPALQAEASTLLKNGFTVSFEDWQANINQHSLAFSADLTVPENQLADVSVPVSLFGLFPLISVSAELSLDEGLMDIPQLYDPLMSLLMTGALVSENDLYRMDASLQNGQVMLNGQPMPLPF